MRIALLPSAYAPAVGGVEVLTARLAHQLVARGHGVEVWTARSKGDTLPSEESIDGIRVRRFVFTLPQASAGSLLRLPLASISTVGQLSSAAHQFKPDVLHVQCFSGNGTYATILSRLAKIPLVVTLQGETVMDDHDIYDHSVTLRRSLRIGLRQAAAVTGCSGFTLEDARDRFGLDVQKAQVIFNGVDVDETPPAAIDLRFERYVLGLGRVVRKKGFDLLLDAFSEIASAHPDVGLVIGGDGAERESLRRRAHDLALAARVHLPGRLRRAEVAAVMRNAEVLVMPSRVEPFGIVALEAWRAGVPVIVSSHGGAPEFIEHGVSGLIVDPFDSSCLGSALESLLASPVQRATLAEAARKELPRFSWVELAQSYELVYLAATGLGLTGRISLSR
jgi:glycogen synthase